MENPSDSALGGLVGRFHVLVDLAQCLHKPLQIGRVVLSAHAQPQAAGASRDGGRTNGRDKKTTLQETPARLKGLAG